MFRETMDCGSRIEAIMGLLFALLVMFCHLVTSQSDTHNSHRNTTVVKPQVYFLHVNSDIKLRYARTVITSRIANPASISQEISFNAILPETAFISGFTIEVDGKEYEAYVKEKEEAKQEYTEAVRQGWTAAHVALNARDSNRFTVSVNVEAQKKVNFKLTYEELLSRKLGTYKHVINLDPGQIVPDLNVQVNIQESSNIATVKVPALTMSNEISDNAGSSNPLATTERPTPQSAVIKFAPTPEQQRELATDGIKGQLTVEYDVDRTTHAGEVLVTEGYFVHFFSPANLTPLRKQVTFVLDVSGSMTGRKIEQLRQAMTTILDDLNPGDLFSIVLFSDTAQVWDPSLNASEIRERMNKLQDHYHWGYPLREHQEVDTRNQTIAHTVIATATHDNLAKAKQFIGQLDALSSTNMYDALMKALEITKLGRELMESISANSVLNQETPEPIIIFLTDGQPNRVKETIVTDITKSNTGKYSIFSLALGDDADLSFLKKLSLRNAGFARKIYEASDTALQLRNFYREVASPLLANITFKYQALEGEPKQITKHNFRRLFFGSELVVAGRLQASNFTVQVEGSSSAGSAVYPFLPCLLPEAPHTNRSVSSMERLWAYLTIQQLLEEDEAKDYNNERNQTSAEKQQALELALQYSFVTSLTSLIVVKPNDSRPVSTRDASVPDYDPNAGSWPIQAPQPLIGAPGLGGRLGSGYFSAPMMAGAGAFIARPAALFQSASQALPGLAGIPPPPSANVPMSNMALGTPGVAQQAGSIGFGLGSAIYQPIAPISLIPLKQVLWLRNNTVTLPNAGTNGTALQLQVAGTDQPNTPFTACGSPAGIGECRHLRYCALDIFASRRSDFDPYFCQIQNFVGVCCPNHIGRATPQGVLANVDTNLVVPLFNMTWLTTNFTITVQNGFGGMNEVLNISSDDQPNLTYGTCISTEGLGFCRHLRHCPLQVFKNSVNEFYPQYFCRIPNNLVGVCCPLTVQW